MLGIELCASFDLSDITLLSAWELDRIHRAGQQHAFIATIGLESQGWNACCRKKACHKEGNNAKITSYLEEGLASHLPANAWMRDTS